jgi:PDZ domain
MKKFDTSRQSPVSGSEAPAWESTVLQGPPAKALSGSVRLVRTSLQESAFPGGSLGTKMVASILFACSVSIACVHGQAQVRQQFQIQQNVIGPAGRPFGVDPQEMEASMRIEVDTIRRVTGLAEAGVKKLEVAAIAAVRNAAKKAEEVNLAIPGFNGDKNVTPAGNTLSDEDAESFDQDAKNDDAAGMAFPPMRVLDIKKVKEETIWKKSLASVLSSEQMAKYENFLADRIKRNRAAAIETKVNQLDAVLLFTPEQRTAISELVDRKIGDELAKIQVPAGGFGGGVGIVVMMAGQPNTDLSVDDLKPIVSEVQLAEYKRKQDVAAQGPFGALQRAMPAVVNAQLGLEPTTQSGLGFAYEEKGQGIEVVSVDEGSLAFRLGLQVGDIVDEFQGTPIDTAIQLKRAIGKRGKEPVMMRVKRSGRVVDLENGEAK